MVTDPPSVGNSSRNRGPTEGEHTCSGGQTESGPTKNVDPQGDAMDTDHSSKVGQGPTEGKDVRDAGPSEKAQVKQHKQKRYTCLLSRKQLRFMQQSGLVPASPCLNSVYKSVSV